MAEKENEKVSINSNASHFYWTKKFWKSFLTYTKNFNSNNPENFKETVNESLKEEIKDLTEFLTYFGTTKINFIRSFAQKHFMKNYADFVKTYNEIIESSKDNPDYFNFNPHAYSYNPKTSNTEFIIELINFVREIKPHIAHGSKEEFLLVQKYLNQDDRDFEKRLKVSYINLIARIGKFLTKFNLIEEYTESFNNNLFNNDLDGLMYPATEEELAKKKLLAKNKKNEVNTLEKNFVNKFSSIKNMHPDLSKIKLSKPNLEKLTLLFVKIQLILEKSDINNHTDKLIELKDELEQLIKEEKNLERLENATKCISVESLFTENYLSIQTLPRLIALAGFWVNRATKAITTLNEIFFIVNEFDLWKNVRFKNKNLSINEVQFYGAVEKITELSKIEDGLFQIMESLQLDRSISPKEINDIFSEQFDKKIEEYKDTYKEKYDLLLPKSNNVLEQDLSSIHDMENTRFLLYRLKDICVFNLIMGSIENHYSKNWGTVPDSNKYFANLHFDIEGLNMPLRLHLYKKELISFLQEYTGDAILPLYKGFSDTEIDGKYITTTILMPLCKKQSTFITEEPASIIKKLDDDKIDIRQKTKLKDVLDFIYHIKHLKTSSYFPPSMNDKGLHSHNAIDLTSSETLRIEPNKKNR